MKTELTGDIGLARVEKMMDYLARRHEALSANVANVSTPGYKSVDVGFELALSEELEGVRIVQTSPRHFEVLVPEPELTLVEVPGLTARPDGNNVALDRELLAMALNRLRFQMGVQWASSRIRTLRAAIAEGRG